MAFEKKLLGRGLWARAKRAGQVTVELLLVLPVFMMLLFFIMELGNLAFQTILVHHCAYELARIGSLVAGPPGGSRDAVDCGKARMKMDSVKAKMFQKSDQIYVTADGCDKPTSVDPQSGATNYDLEVTVRFPAKLVFPLSSYWFADESNKASGIRTIIVKVRMPIEKPVFQ